jgi:hypothetical protein
MREKSCHGGLQRLEYEEGPTWTSGRFILCKRIRKSISPALRFLMELCSSRHCAGGAAQALGRGTAWFWPAVNSAATSRSLGRSARAGNWAWGKMRPIRTHHGRQQLTRLSPWTTAPKRRIPDLIQLLPQPEHDLKCRRNPSSGVLQKESDPKMQAPKDCLCGSSGRGSNRVPTVAMPGAKTVRRRLAGASCLLKDVYGGK